MAKVFESPSNLSEYLFRITDNCGQSADRYTVLFSDGSYLALSSYPTHPQGVSISGGEMGAEVMAEWVENGEAVDVALGDLPPSIVDHIVFRANQGAEYLLELVERKDPMVVAPSREKASINDNTRDCGGQGIYHTEEGYFVRIDGDPSDDRGPYRTAREAVLCSLPDQHALAPEEYHSPLKVTRMEPDREVLRKVEELEAKRDEEWKRQRAVRA